MPGQKLFGILRCHTAHACRGHGLAVNMVGQIACSKNTRDRSAGAARLNLNIAAIVQGQLILDQFRCRRVTNGHKEAVARHIFNFIR